MRVPESARCGGSPSAADYLWQSAVLWRLPQRRGLPQVLNHVHGSRQRPIVLAEPVDEPATRADDRVGELNACTLRDLLAEALDRVGHLTGRFGEDARRAVAVHDERGFRKAAPDVARAQSSPGERAPVVRDDDIGRVASQRLVHVCGRREERWPHHGALGEWEHLHVRVPVRLLPVGAQTADVAAGCDEQLDVVASPRERDRQQRIGRPRPAGPGDTEQLVTDDADAPRRHRLNVRATRANARLAKLRRGACEATGSAAAVRVTSSARKRRFSGSARSNDASTRSA